MKTRAQWYSVLLKCGVKPTTAHLWSAAFETVITATTFSKPNELPYFLGQVLHESGKFEHTQENLSYSAARLMQVWPKRFPTLSVAEQYERNPAKLAEFVYSGRMGNDEPGDGFKFIGRGPIMITGKDNYRAARLAAGVDLLKFPEAAADPVVGLKIAVAWWEKNIPDSLVGDVESISKRVNGGLVGGAERIRYTNLALAATV